MKLKKQYDAAADTVKEGLFGVLIFVGAVWGVFFVDLALGLATNLELAPWLDLHPRQMRGVIGIVTMPLVHEGWVHLISNTIPLVVLLTLLASLRSNSWGIVAAIIAISGSMTWLIGDSQKSHVGASGLVLGLITFFIASGLFEVFTVQRATASEGMSVRVSMRRKSLLPLVISILVGLLFGTSLLRGLVPQFPLGNEPISWSGHWCGAIAGAVVAYWTTQSLLRRPRATARRLAAREIHA